MDDLRIKKIEMAVKLHDRKLEEHEKLHAESRKDICMLQDIAKSNQEILETLHRLAIYAEKTYDVFEPLARYGVRVAKYSAILMAGWHAAKWFGAKIIAKLSVVKAMMIT